MKRLIAPMPPRERQLLSALFAFSCPSYTISDDLHESLIAEIDLLCVDIAATCEKIDESRLFWRRVKFLRAHVVDQNFDRAHSLLTRIIKMRRKENS